LLTAVGLTPGGSSTVHIYTKTVHRTTQLTIKKAVLLRWGFMSAGCTAMSMGHITEDLNNKGYNSMQMFTRIW